MAKITRFTIKQFGSSGPSGDFGQFGSLAASSPNYTKDPATIQSLAAFLTGWAAETIATNRPALEDMNGLDFLIFQALCYFQQAGIPEYDAGTTYYQYSICQYGGVIYQSLVDSNTGNTPAVGAYWSLLSYVDLSSAQTIAGVKTFSSFPVTPSSAPSTNYQVANKKYVDDLVNGIGLVDYSSSSTVIGWSSFTTKKIYTTKIGSMVFVFFNIAGTSNATTVSFTLPYAINADLVASGIGGLLLYTYNAGAYVSTPGHFVANNATTITANKAYIGADGWANSGTKQVVGQFSYIAA